MNRHLIKFFIKCQSKIVLNAHIYKHALRCKVGRGDVAVQQRVNVEKEDAEGEKLAHLL